MIDDSAVSEVVGYIITVGIVMIAISLVYLNAIPAITSTESIEHNKNVERVFGVLHSNIEEISQNNVPSKGTEFKLKNGQLNPSYKPTLINITVEDSGGVIYTTEIKTAIISYKTPEARTSYEMGSLIKHDVGTDSTAMLESPSWRIEENKPLIMNLIDIDGESEIRGGHQIVLIKLDQNEGVSNSQVFRDVQTMTLEINSTNIDTWERYFDGLELTTNIDPSIGGPNKAEITIDGDGQTLIFSRTVISTNLS